MFILREGDNGSLISVIFKNMKIWVDFQKICVIYFHQLNQWLLNWGADITRVQETGRGISAKQWKRWGRLVIIGQSLSWYLADTHGTSITRQRMTTYDFWESRLLFSSSFMCYERTSLIIERGEGGENEKKTQAQLQLCNDRRFSSVWNTCWPEQLES